MPKVQDIQELNFINPNNPQMMPRQNMRPQYMGPNYPNQQFDDDYYNNYSDLPMQDIYHATTTRRRRKEDSEYRTFINFLKYKEALDFTENLERHGVITIKRPNVIDIKERKTRLSIFEFLTASFVIFGLIRILLLILL